VANHVSRARIDEMWTVYRDRQSVREVSEKCAVHHKTVDRYRKLERWDERLREVRENAQREADYDLSKALADSLRIVRTYKGKLVDGLANRRLSGAEVTAAEIEKVVRLEAFILGGAESRHEVVSRFEGWTEEELEAYASSGKLPDRSSSGAT
jgi:hypothetical protein